MPTTISYTYARKASTAEETLDLERGIKTSLETHFPTLTTTRVPIFPGFEKTQYEIPTLLGTNTISLKQLNHEEVYAEITTSGPLGGNVSRRLKGILSDLGFKYNPEFTSATHTTIFKKNRLAAVVATGE